MSARLCRALAALLLAGCASAHVRTADDPGTPGRGGLAVPARAPADPRRVPFGDPRGDPRGEDLPSTTEHATSTASRRVCRTGSWPSGWIAVAYESASGDECPKGKADYPVALLVSYRDQPSNATLDVCADQPVPTNWRVDEESADVGNCPGAVRGGGSATKRIRRVR